MKKTSNIKVGITQGDINGIGYEVILKMLEDPRMAEMCTIVIYGSAKIAAFYRKAEELPEVKLVQIDSAEQAREGSYSIINVVGEDTKVEPGVASAVAGEAAFKALERATADLRAGAIDVLVTAPVNKATIHSDTFPFPGHTEYLESVLAENEGDKALMVLATDDIKVALVTTHVPLKDVPALITKEAVEEKIMALHRSLVRDYSISSPRIAVLALNPHAGDNGLLGAEETESIAPAIESAHSRKVLCFGPYPADGFWGSDAYTHFDGVVAMYHDQGLAPFKALEMNLGVNFTAGLPYVRTSPDHGTAYDIAGKGVADPESMRHAVYMALDIYRNRERHDYATRNPLRKVYFEKGNDNVVLDLTKDE